MVVEYDSLSFLGKTNNCHYRLQRASVLITNCEVVFTNLIDTERKDI